MAAPLSYPARTRRPLVASLSVCVVLGLVWGALFWFGHAPWWAGLPIVPLGVVLWLLLGRRAARKNSRERLENALDAALRKLEGSEEVENPFAVLLDAINAHPDVAGAALFVTGGNRSKTGLSPTFAAGALLGLRTLPRVADGEHLSFLTRGEDLLHRRVLRDRVENGQNATSARPLLSVLEDANLDLMWVLTDEEGTFGAVVLREAVGGDFSTDEMRDSLAARAARVGRALRKRAILPTLDPGPGGEPKESAESLRRRLTDSAEFSRGASKRLTDSAEFPRHPEGKRVTDSTEFRRSPELRRLAEASEGPKPVEVAPEVPKTSPEETKSTEARATETRSTPPPEMRPASLLPSLASFFEDVAPLRELFVAVREAERAGVVRLAAGKASAARGVARALSQARGEPLREADGPGEGSAVWFWDEDRLGPYAVRDERAGVVVVRVSSTGTGYRVPLVEELDAALLAESFLARVGEGHSVEESGRNALRAYRWPGELEELCLVVARAALLAGPGGALRDDAFEALGERSQAESLAGRDESEEGEGLDAAEALPALVGEVLSEGALDAAPVLFHEAVHFFKREVLKRALAKTDGNRAQAARLLGLQRTYLYRLIRQLEVEALPEAQKAFDETSAAR